MLKNLSHRLLLLPLLFLIGFIGVYGYVEFKKISNDAAMRAVIEDPTSEMAKDIYVAALTLNAAYKQYKPTMIARPTEPTPPLQGALDELIKKEHVLSAFLMKDAFEAEEHLAELDRLKIIAESISKIKIDIDSHNWQNEKDQEEFEKKLITLVGVAQDLDTSIHTTHKKTVQYYLERIKRDEKQRAILLVLMLISGFVLVIALVDAVYHHKANAERAQAAEKCNALFAAALQHTRVGVLIRDMRQANRPVVFLNEAFTRLTGYKLEELATQTSEFLFGWNTDQAAIAAFRRAVSLQETTILDTMLYRKDGSPFWSEWHLTPLMGSDGKLAYFVSLLSDKTNLRQVQEDLLQAKAVAEHASAVKTSFLAMMSHEIRTPINGILGVLKLLGETRLDPEQQHLIGIAKTSSSVLHGIINDILDYAKMEAGKIEIIIEPFRINELVTELAELGRSLMGDKKVVLETEIDKNLAPFVNGDVGRVRQILLNLLSNAIKFTDSGYIRLRVFPLMQQEVQGQAGALVRFEVQDSGAGISVSEQDKLFQEFSQVDRSYSRRFGGTGLGLAICRRLIGMMGGEIGVESQPGKGSRFWFILPLQTAQEGEEGQRQATLHDIMKPAHAGRKDVRVLLVEDNDTNRLVARRYIEKMGLVVDEACDGAQAVEKVKNADYDIVLMDVSMPVMDGMMATCHIRALGGKKGELPIIALTAHAMAGDKQLCLAAGMNDYMQKPLEYTQLMRILDRWIGAGVAVLEQPSSGKEVLHPAHDSLSSETAGGGGGEAVGEMPVPLFDADVLKRMRNDLGGAAVSQVTSVYLADSAGRIARMEQSLSLDVLRDEAHTLKSCSSNCGLMRLGRLMSQIEAAASCGDRIKARSLFDVALSVYAASRERLENERSKYID